MKPYWRMKMALNKEAFSCFLRLPAMFLFLALLPAPVQAQKDSTVVDRKKLNTLIIASGIGYTARLVVLDHVWYQNTERQSFRFFNDNAEWKQMDKGGHFFNSYQLSAVPSRVLRSCG